MRTVHRLPRPFGITALMVEYHNTGDPLILHKAQHHIINQWILTNGYVSGVPYTINKLAILLHVDIHDIRVVMRDQMLNAKIWNHDNQKEIMEGMLGEQLSWVLEDRMAVSQQVELLREAQGDTYKPFISAEVNKAMKLKLDTTNNLQQVIRSITGGSTFNINIDQSENNNIQNNSITIEEARMLVMDTNKEMMSDKSKELKLLETKYDIKSLPEVVATKQEGIDVSKEGLGFNSSELDIITDNYRDAMKESHNSHHEMRREIELKVDPDSPDPELSMYEDYYKDEEEEHNGIPNLIPPDFQVLT